MVGGDLHPRRRVESQHGRDLRRTARRLALRRRRRAPGDRGRGPVRDRRRRTRWRVGQSPHAHADDREDRDHHEGPCRDPRGLPDRLEEGRRLLGSLTDQTQILDLDEPFVDVSEPVGPRRDDRRAAERALRSVGRSLQMGPSEVRAAHGALHDETVSGPPVVPGGPSHDHPHHLLLGSGGGFARPMSSIAGEGRHPRTSRFCAFARARAQGASDLRRRDGGSGHPGVDPLLHLSEPDNELLHDRQGDPRMIEQEVLESLGGDAQRRQRARGPDRRHPRSGSQ